jgi:TonB family protein
MCLFSIALLLGVQAASAAGRRYLLVRNGGFVIAADDGLQKVFTVMRRAPEYPYEGRRNHLSGAGLFRADVAPSGAVTGVKVVKSTGHRVLDEAIKVAVQTWQTPPGKKREVDFAIAFIAPSRGMPPAGL